MKRTGDPGCDSDLPAEKDPWQGGADPVIDRVPLPMAEVEGPEHIVCFVNAAFCDLLGKTREELVGRRFSDLICHGAKSVDLLAGFGPTGALGSPADADDLSPAYWLSARWPPRDGSDRSETVIIHVSRVTEFRQNAAALNEALLLSGLQQHDLRVAAEKLNASLAVENAERRRVEAELQTAHAALRASAAKLEQTVQERTAQLRVSITELEAFAYSLAHDLRAPLRAIHGFTQFALEMSHKEVGPAATELLRRVVKAATRMDSLIQDVLDLSQVIHRPIVLAPVDVDALVKALVEERPELSPPRAEVRIESPLIAVLAHEATLSQCLTNLLSNAVKFVAPGVSPRVRVWTEEREGPTARSMVRLWVEDNGIGIAAEDRERIFEIFQRLNNNPLYDGSGIGLAIVRKATERMGGRCGVGSGGSNGTRFWVELPKA